MDADRDLIRVFPVRTDHTPIDNMSFVGLPPKNMYFDPWIRVAISITFTWHISEGVKLWHEWKKYFYNVSIGGPAFKQPCNGFMPERFVRAGVTFTSRGCIRKCPWCYEVYEGGLKEINPIAPGYILWDPNLFQCSDKHIREVFKMLQKQSNPAIFAGGLDFRLFNEWHINLFQTIKIGKLYFAIDTLEILKIAERKVKLLQNKPSAWRNVYVLCGFQETLKEAKNKVKNIKNLGLIPKVMLYQNDNWKHYTEDWLNLKNENLITESNFA